MLQQVADILEENSCREELRHSAFDPITGKGSIGKRVALRLDDFAVKEQFIPTAMTSVPLVAKLRKHKSIAAMISKELKATPSEALRGRIAEELIRLRCLYDFPFWAASFVYIKRKGGGEDCRFVLTAPQRKLVAKFEEARLAGKPIRVILLKARQWGGSTTSQLYMAWLQLMHQVGLNSLIIAHVRDASVEIKDMFDRMLNAYPRQMLFGNAEADGNAPKMTSVLGSQNTFRIPSRNCKIKIGTAEKPDSCRGGDYNLVHLSEVGVWQKTDGKSPEDIVQSACSGIMLKPYTMIVYESTAKGTGNFFQHEYDAAKAGHSQFQPLFISWFDIEQNSIPFANDEEREVFAQQLWERRFSDAVESDREEPGKYLWWLWQIGASLEAINWYITERRGKNDHAVMASEAPSDDVEAFANSGAIVFDNYQVAKLAEMCRPPSVIGEMDSDALEGEECLNNLRFVESRGGNLAIWHMPEDNPDGYNITDRYLTVVDVGGRGQKADWSVIVVFDRLAMTEADGKPVVAAQWRGHCDIDQLAWTAAKIAAFYNESLLVIESNTMETRDRNRDVDGDQSLFILNQIRDVYPNLYARTQSEDDIRSGIPRKYGFHTNIKTKPLVISTLIKAVRDGLWVEYDEKCIDELKSYEKKKDNSYGAAVGKHDDILMTRAIGLYVCFSEMELPQIVATQRQPMAKKHKPATEARF